MAKKIDNKILEELKRFQTITNNSQNLNEQMVGGVATFEMGSHVDRLLQKAKAMEMAEQEVPELELELEPELFLGQFKIVVARLISPNVGNTLALLSAMDLSCAGNFLATSASFLLLNESISVFLK